MGDFAYRNSDTEAEAIHTVFINLISYIAI